MKVWEAIHLKNKSVSTTSHKAAKDNFHGQWSPSGCHEILGPATHHNVLHDVVVKKISQSSLQNL